MFRIALDFGRMALVALNEQPGGVTAQGHCGCEVKWFSQCQFLRLFNVRNNSLDRLLGAGRQSRQGERSAHQLQKLSPMMSAQPLRSSLGKFALEKLDELLRACDLIQAAPVARTAPRSQFFSNG